MELQVRSFNVGGGPEQGTSREGDPSARMEDVPLDGLQPEQSTARDVLPGRPSRSAQFGAVLRKNFILMTRRRRVLCGLGGWAALILEVLVPALFFALMCVPKYYLPKPFPMPEQLTPPLPLDRMEWATQYTGPAAFHGMEAKVVFTPNTTDTARVMQNFARAVACLADPGARAPQSSSFFAMFAVPGQPPACGAAGGAGACRANPACWEPLFLRTLEGFATEAEALEDARLNPNSVDALIVFSKLGPSRGEYTLRGNHTAGPSTRMLLNPFDLLPDATYKSYWFLANLQHTVDRAIMGTVIGSGGAPAEVQVDFKPFPWPQAQFDPGAILAAAAFNLLLVYAFLAPTRSAVVTIVREKELRLREGMRILGLKDAAYWASWGITHWTTMAVSGAICAAIAIYPFKHSDFTVMLVLFWLVACSLISFSYFLSTLFSKSRVAGTASAMLYAMAMVPGYLMPTFQPYGGAGWQAACLLPPSAVSLFASVLLRLEGGGRGIRWSSLSLGVTNQDPFSAATVFIMLTADIFIYAVLTWYFDNVIPSEFGQNLPFYFPLQPSYWLRSVGRRPKAVGLAAAAAGLGAGGPSDADPDVVVSIKELRKVFRTTDGTKTAVDGLTLDIHRDQITALLGHNGAGKTTTISILTGMIKPTSGGATVCGRSILTHMGEIRESLGVCPQFDILWPEITVGEHLYIYASIKGYSKAAATQVAYESAKDVGLEEKLDTMAGDLSGGQRRKLSVAIAFLGQPAVVFLDEPTSGMDPYSRRFTWDVIRRNRVGRAIVLTSHSMEEADLLGDTIAIMAAGRLAALGTSLDLKARFGIGYTLTIVRSRHPSRNEGLDSLQGNGGVASLGSDADLDSLIKRHVAHAELSSRSAGEVAYRLPKEDASSFPALLRELERESRALGVDSYGLSVTTLEEVFLSVSAGAGEKMPKLDGSPGPAATGTPGAPPSPPPVPGMGDDNGRRLKGVRLYLQQLYGLFVKRALSARRDKLAVVTQLLVPVALVAVALWAGRASSRLPQEPALALNRGTCLMGRSTPWAATDAVRGNATQLAGLLDAYGPAHLIDSGRSSVYQGSGPVGPTLDGFLLDRWFTNQEVYDSFLVRQGLTEEGSAAYTVMANQTAVHSLPAALNAVNSALLKVATGDPAAEIVAVNEPMPTLKDEALIKVSQAAGALLLVLCLTMAASVLSSAYAVFVVRERESRSKHVQLVSGAPLSAFWAANYAWDMATFCVPAAFFVGCFLIFNLPQYRGDRLAAAIIMLFMFGLAALPLTYFLSSFFEDEMKAFQRINTFTFLVGFLGFLAVWILELVSQAFHAATPRRIFRITSTTLRVISPHFNLARGMQKISEAYHQDEGLPDAPAFTFQASGKYFLWMGIQAVGFAALTLLVESGWLGVVWHAVQKVVVRWVVEAAGPTGRWAELARHPSGQPLAEEDEDVREERTLLQNGGWMPEAFHVLLDGVSKTYSQGMWRPPVFAVRPMWLGVPSGECFGLLGINGAGKTTTFRMLTGEITPDEGDAYVATWSVRRQLAVARRCMGYCPQFNALPGALTAREVLWLYARLRGVPPAYIPGVVSALLERIDLMQYADRACETFSGGNKRKLSVAVALVGSPPVVLLDEPSTGMDPGARRFLWTIIQKQVIDRGHTVILTSHSMEECEALCGRLGIMAAGRLHCLGSPQHLKNRFGAGYALELRLRSEAHVAEALALVHRLCPAALLTQRNGTRLSFRIPQQALDLPAAFEGIEAARDACGIEEFSLSQTTLEHVFVAVAQQGQGADAGAPGAV